MSKIEPMTVEEIRGLIAGIHPVYFDPLTQGSEKAELLSLILAWAHERARANQYEDMESRCKCDYCVTAWRNEVLDEIGFPHE